MTKGVKEKIDESFFRWSGHVERMENERIAKRVYVGECAGSRSVGRLRKRCIDTMKKYLKKRSLDIRLARRMVQIQDRSERWGFVKENGWAFARGINP